MWKCFRIEELEKLHRSPSSFQFGITMAVVFLIITVVSQKWLLGGVSVAFLLISFVRPYWLDGLNRLWFLLGLCLGWLMSPVFLIIFYYIIFSPMALMLKIFGHKSFVKTGWIKKNKSCEFTRNF